MALDTLEIFGDEFTGVTGIKATDDNDNIKTYIRPDGTKSISENGNGIDVTEYAAVDVNISGGLTIDDIYPVGSIYMSVTSTSPSVLFGGTWEQIQGRFLVGSGSNGAAGDESLNPTAGNTGGKATVTLTSAQSGVPSHSHDFTQPTVTTPTLTASNSNYVTSASEVTSLRANLSSSTSSNYYYIRAASSGVNMGKSAPTITSGKSCTVTGGAVSDNTASNASSSHENLPPYLAVYMWKRTA